MHNLLKNRPFNVNKFNLRKYYANQVIQALKVSRVISDKANSKVKKKEKF